MKPFAFIFIVCSFSMALVVQAQTDPSNLGPFGIGSCHVNGLNVQDYERWVPQMMVIGLRYLRSYPVGLGQMQPEGGRFDWRAMEAQMDYLEVHQLPLRVGVRQAEVQQVLPKEHHRNEVAEKALMLQR